MCIRDRAVRGLHAELALAAVADPQAVVAPAPGAPDDARRLRPLADELGAVDARGHVAELVLEVAAVAAHALAARPRRRHGREGLDAEAPAAAVADPDAVAARAPGAALHARRVRLLSHELRAHDLLSLIH